MRKKNDYKLDEVLKLMVRQNRWDEKLDRVKIREVWVSAMGETVNKYTKHVTLRKNTLVVLIDSAPLKQELSYGKEKIKKIMNEALGKELIKEVILH